MNQEMATQRNVLSWRGFGRYVKSEACDRRCMRGMCSDIHHILSVYGHEPLWTAYVLSACQPSE